MKLKLNKTVTLDRDYSAEDKPEWITVNDKIILDTKYTLFNEDDMLSTIYWLHWNTDFNKHELFLRLEDCISMIYE